MKNKLLILLIIMNCLVLTSCTKITISNDDSDTKSESSESQDNDEIIDDDEKADSDTESSNESSQNKTEVEVSNTDTTNSSSTKEVYLKKLEEIENGLSDLDDLKNGNTIEMKQAASEEYERYDDALNEIYSVLKGQLSDSEMKSLEKEELEWIQYKENKALEDSSEYKGGTAENLIYTSSLAESTKERCYYLVNTYMK